MGKHTLASDVTPEERALGFEVVEHGSRRVVSLALPHDLVAVKMHDEEGATEYVLCTETLEPIIVGGKTLAELEERFGEEWVERDSNPRPTD